MFENYGLNPSLLKGIEALGYQTPTQIQQLTIPQILASDEDLIGLAQTGTGKTAGFGLPILHRLDTSQKKVQALILSPTRELALQIASDLQQYARFMPQVKIAVVYGGASIEKQIAELKKGVHIVVGTPGRTLDLIKRRKLKVDAIRWLVLDEADEMLNMGFRDELDAILENTPQDKQTLLFSATMPAEVKRIADRYLREPVELSAGKRNIGAKNVEHEYYVVKEKNRYEALRRLVDYQPDIYGIVFCRTRAETRDIASRLIDDGYSADALHGDLSQAQRDFVMKRFRTRQIQLLVATDVAARGLDINDLTHIINYNLPDDPEVYIHRSGRTGRAGKSGISMVIITPKEAPRIRQLERITGKKFTKKDVPTGQQIYKRRLFSYAEKIENTVVDDADFSEFMQQIAKKLSWLDKDELLKRVFYVEFQRFLDYSEDNRNINQKIKEKDLTTERKKDRRRSRSKEFTRFFINIGTKQHLQPRNLIGLINELTDSNSIEIGKIDIQRNFSFFEVEKSAEWQVREAFAGAIYGSTQLRIEKADKEKQKRTRGKRSHSRVR